MIILVFNKNKGSDRLPYEEQVKAFSSLALAVDYAKSIGYQDSFGLGINLKAGTKTVAMSGDTHVEILPLKVNP